MFAAFRRYQKWIWIGAVIVVIPSFVIFLSPDGSSGVSTGSGKNAPYTIDGKPVTIDGEPISNGQFLNAMQETRLALFIRSGGREWPKDTDRLENEAIYRIFLLKKLKEMDIEVSEAAAAQMARNRLGNYPYANFKEDILTPNRLSSSDFERYIHNEAAILQLVNVAALNSKLVTPDEAEFVYRQENEEVSTAAVVFWKSNYLDQIEITDEAISQHYTNTRALYRIPARAEVSYVAFMATNFYTQAEDRLNQLTNLTQLIDEEYFRIGPDNFKDTNDVVLSAEAAKERIKETYRHAFALNMAHQKANGFGAQIMENQNPNNTNTFVQLAKQDGYEIQVTPPFDSLEGLEGTGLPEEFAEQGSKLTPQQPNLFQPIRGTNAVYVISFRNKVPSKMQELDEVREKVVEDYRNREATTLAYSAGTNFYTFLTNGIAQNKSFADLTAEKKVTVVDIPPFSPSTQSITNLDERLNLNQLRRLAFQDMEPGDVSRFIRTPDGGYVLYMKERLPFDQAKIDKELPETMERLRQIRQTEAFNQWFGKQAQQSLVIPQRPPPPTPAGGAMPGMPPVR